MGSLGLTRVDQFALGTVRVLAVHVTLQGDGLGYGVSGVPGLRTRIASNGSDSVRDVLVQRRPSVDLH